ncbi:branched-chain amino acid transport system permease protein [Rhodoligotrophos appendicifer]|uniref:branched-chain amino acid ABC transporter permease n=1 Tax=Rhodoligotrophos appendicifer TaxID=987056 RepID=UPI0011865097|nr:branched-chain amino acid ABC transporter permease [Rhodoligotrophos appendicifer]
MPKLNVATLALAAAAVATMAVLLTTNDGYTAKLIGWIAISALLAASLRFVLLIGELNFAIAGFFGIGAYTSGMATAVYEVSFPLALLIGAVAAGLASFLFGFVTLRVKGPYFLLIGFAFTEVLRLIYTQTDYIGGSSGLIGIFPPIDLEPIFPAVVVALVILVLIALYLVERSDLGKVFGGIRNNDAVVRTTGVNVHMTKVLCVVIASVAAGLGGGLQAHSNNVISPGDFSFVLSTFALAFVKVGGEEHIMGAVLGAIIMTLIAQYALGLEAMEHIVFGAAIVAVTLLLPHGLFGVLKRFWARIAPGAKPAALASAEAKESR